MPTTDGACRLMPLFSGHKKQVACRNLRDACTILTTRPIIFLIEQNNMTLAPAAQTLSRRPRRQDAVKASVSSPVEASKEATAEPAK
nr:hypothetical protein [uncultured Cohaesibacter sp.]